VFDTIILLTEDAERDPLVALLHTHNPQLSVLTPHSKLELAAIPDATLARARIIGFLTPVVVPAEVLAALGHGAYNFHPGPPNYPGWLPSHFAVYDRAAFFGATAHEMVAQVDAGPIVGVELFGVPPGASVEEIDRLAFVQCARLIWRFAPALACDPAPLPVLPVQWSGRRSTKAMVREACDIPADITKDELERRLAAFGAGHFGDVPTVTLHGHTFRYVAPEPRTVESPTLAPEAQTASEAATLV
jgi:methionyl-tRNA formyltransferase